MAKLGILIYPILADLAGCIGFYTNPFLEIFEIFKPLSSILESSNKSLKLLLMLTLMLSRFVCLLVLSKVRDWSEPKSVWSNTESRSVGDSS
jgi:hypothetical protein